MRKRRRGAVIVSRPSGSAIGRRSAPVTVCVLNAAAFSGMGSSIVLELADEVAALRSARKIARETGRCVTRTGRKYGSNRDHSRRRDPLGNEVEPRVDFIAAELATQRISA